MVRRALLVALLWLPAPLLGQQLGALRFPNSAAASAQAPFIRGVLYLHSFEYPSALKAFREAEQADTGFALNPPRDCFVGPCRASSQ
jgi:hypothetical protein